MSRKRIDTALRRTLELGEYVVDAPAVAEAMLASGVLVALQAGDLAAVRAEHDEPFAGLDAA
jgi:hypothetical protein